MSVMSFHGSDQYLAFFEIIALRSKEHPSKSDCISIIALTLAHHTQKLRATCCTSSAGFAS